MPIVRIPTEGETIEDVVTKLLRAMPVTWVAGDERLWAAMDAAFLAVRGTPIDRADSYELATCFCIQGRLAPEQ